MVSRSRGNAGMEKSKGERQGSANKPAMKVTVDGEILRKLYARMLRSRMTAETQESRFMPDKEAAIGAIMDLLPGDAVAPSCDGGAIQLALPIATSATRDSSLHVLPAHLGVAAGVALAYKLQVSHNVVVALSDGRALELGSSHEALNLVAKHKLPIVVVVDCGVGQDPDLMVKADAYGIPGITVDGSDAVAVYRVSREAIHRARSGRGPTLIECRTFEPQRDPIAHMEKYLEKQGWWTTEWKRQLSAEYQVLGARRNH